MLRLQRCTHSLKCLFITVRWHFQNCIKPFWKIYLQIFCTSKCILNNYLRNRTAIFKELVKLFVEKHVLFVLLNLVWWRRWRSYWSLCLRSWLTGLLFRLPNSLVSRWWSSRCATTASSNSCARSIGRTVTAGALAQVNSNVQHISVQNNIRVCILVRIAKFLHIFKFYTLEADSTSVCLSVTLADLFLFGFHRKKIIQFTMKLYSSDFIHALRYLAVGI